MYIILIMHYINYVESIATQLLLNLNYRKDEYFNY